MPIIDTSPTLENFKKARISILELMNNPWIDLYDLENLRERLRKINREIEKLESKSS